MLAYLRARAISSGFLGGSRMWIGIGFVVWTIKFFQWLVRAETEVIYREPLGAGQSVTIHHGDAPPTDASARRRRSRPRPTPKKDAKSASARRNGRGARREGSHPGQKQAKQAARTARKAGSGPTQPDRTLAFRAERAARAIMDAVKVLLRNPRREVEVQGAMQVSTLLGRLDINRESVLVIRDDTIVAGDGWLNDDDDVEIRPVISGGMRVKCRVCREPAIIDIRRHNANFCAEHFLKLCRDQTVKAIERVRHDRSPASGCWSRCPAARTRSPSGTSCSTSATTPTASTSGLGIGDYSDASGEYARAFARSRGATLIEVDLPDRLRLRHPDRVRAPPSGCRARRAGCRSGTCSTRPPSTAATTSSSPATTSTTRPPCCSATCCAGRPTTSAASCPVLPARHGFPRKVKPLVRLGEREMAAYCVVRGIDYIVDECPMAAGNKHLGYKEALNAIEATSPGHQARLLLRVPRPGLGALPPRGRGRAGRPAALHRRAARRRPAEVCAFCRLVERAGGQLPDRSEPVPVPVDAEPVARPHRRSARVSRPAARPASACCSSTTRSAATWSPSQAGGEFHSHAGFVPHDDLIGQRRGPARPLDPRRVLPRAAPDAVRLRPEDAARRPGDLPEGPRPDPDAGRHLPGCRVLESGVGSGALSMTMLRAGADDHRLRAARGLRQPGPQPTSSRSSAPRR